MRFSNTHGMAAVLATAASLAGATSGSAQIGAIGGAPGGAIGGAEATARAPVFSESALVLPQGVWTATALAGLTSGGIGIGAQSLDYTFTQVLLGAFYAPVERLTIGATIFPYAAASVDFAGESADESGRGDATAYAKYQLWRADDERTAVAGIANIGLPIGDDDFGSEGVSIGLGGVVSHALERVTLHGGVGVDVPTADEDGETSFLFSAAAVYGATPMLSVGVELFGATASIEAIDDRFTSIEVAPGARLRVGERLFLNGGVQLNLSTSPGDALYDYAVLIGASLTR